MGRAFRRGTPRVRWLRLLLSLSIHIPVGGASYNAAVQASAFLNKQLGNEEVDFKHKHTPHVTLEACAWRRRALRS